MVSVDSNIFFKKSGSINFQEPYKGKYSGQNPYYIPTPHFENPYSFPNFSPILPYFAQFWPIFANFLVSESLQLPQNFKKLIQSLAARIFTRGTISGNLHAKFQNNLRSGYREMLKNYKNTPLNGKCGQQYFFFENPAPLLFRNHIRLPSC